MADTELISLGELSDGAARGRHSRVFVLKTRRFQASRVVRAFLKKGLCGPEHSST
jgi:hypothetical protein